MAETEIKLTPEQQAAWDLMLAGKNVFLTGEAGTGKSTILHKFKEQCQVVRCGVLRLFALSAACAFCHNSGEIIPSCSAS